MNLRTRLLIATLAVATIGILASDVAANMSLRTFLVNQIDSQLVSISNDSIQRLDRAGIATKAYSAEGDDALTFHPVMPMNSVPTSTSVTLLDLSGTVVGKLGGDLTSAQSEPTFKGLTVTKILALNSLPFTFHATRDGPDTRAIAKVLPSGLGTVVFSESLGSVDRTLRELRILFGFITLIVLLLIGLLAWWIIRLNLRPLREVEKTAAAIAEGDLSARLPAVNPRTEVGSLTTSLNTMLARIEESFALRLESESKLRRFAADASHELRTPLTAIRGFAELHRQGAVVGEAKTKELILRIEKESIRMGSLVEDLLLLARMDQHREIVLEPVELNLLIHEVVASANAADKDHSIAVDIAHDENFVLGDSMRIHQAVANLIANAQAHTPIGTPIKVSVIPSEDEISINVTDIGPGLSEEDQARIFERFYRADPARVRKNGEGSGLGLAIVDAVMKAHSGTVSVNSELGKGSTFTLHFPLIAD